MVEDGSDMALLEEELLQLSLSSLKVVPPNKPSFVCSVWWKKTYNVDSFWAQMRSI